MSSTPRSAFTLDTASEILAIYSSIRENKQLYEKAKRSGFISRMADLFGARLNEINFRKTPLIAEQLFSIKNWSEDIILFITPILKPLIQGGHNLIAKALLQKAEIIFTCLTPDKSIRNAILLKECEVGEALIKAHQFDTELFNKGYLAHEFGTKEFLKIAQRGETLADLCLKSNAINAALDLLTKVCNAYPHESESQRLIQNKIKLIKARHGSHLFNEFGERDIRHISKVITKALSHKRGLSKTMTLAI